MTDPEITENSSSEHLEDGVPPRPHFGLSRRGTVGLIIVAALLVGGAVGLVKWNENHNELQAAQRSEALAQAWKKAQPKRAQGVDFELKISSTSAAGHPVLVFDHSGKVTAKDSCFQASSKYMVLKDGSLVIRDLSGTDSGNRGDCAGKSISPIFLSSKVSFQGKGWTAYGPDEKALVENLKEIDSKVKTA